MQILEKTGMKAWNKAVSMKPDDIINLIGEKKLIGRGGACFPTAKKWGFAKEQESDDKYLICNADEGEPGTFKDKFIMENNPENMIEGILIACYTIGAKQAYIYLRREYRYLEKGLKKIIIGMIKKSGTDINIEIILGAGAYICGEETAIINSIEGKRGEPYLKPPYPAVEGLFSKPTVIDNVETLANVPLVMFDENWNPDLRLFSLSGNLKKPGIYEAEVGITMGELMKMGRPDGKIKAVYFGCAGGCMSFKKDTKVDYDVIDKAGCMLGSCTVIAVNEKNSIVDMAAVIAKFFEFESCGKCTPCREGTMRILALLEKISLGYAKPKDIELLEELSIVIRDSALCGLGKSSTTHVLTALSNFRNEFEEKCR